MQLLKLLFNPIREPQSLTGMEDPTIYKVVTQNDTYCGRISYQDNNILWLRAGDKPVKILKENIVRINII
jgi:hypothetical protein